MDDYPTQNQKDFRPKWLRLGEYGAVLSVIPGVFLSLLTGQFAFAASPIVISLWLNLYCRAQGDRWNKAHLVTQSQEATYRFESVLESLKRERAEFLLDHAGFLTPRDYPPLLEILSLKLACIEENQDSMQNYLTQRNQVADHEFSELKITHGQQQRSLEQISGLVSDAEVSIFLGQLEALEERMATLEAKLFAVWNPCKHFYAGLSALEQDLVRMGAAQSRVDENLIQDYWRPLENSLRAQIDVLHVLCVNNQLDMVQQLLSERIAECQAKIQNYQDERQQLEKELKHTIDEQERVYQALMHQTAAWETESLVQTIGSQQSVDFDRIDWQIRYELQPVKQQLQELNIRVKQRLELELTLILDEVTALTAARIKQISYQAEQPRTDEAFLDHLNVCLTPLLQHLSECNEQLMELSHNFAQSKDQIEVIESELTTMSDRIELECSDFVERVNKCRQISVQ
ncbi:MAG: hypothetical protein AAGB01_09485, partial [Cyanobacteria bacterium P01_F01_bin.42]